MNVRMIWTVLSVMVWGSVGWAQAPEQAAAATRSPAQEPLGFWDADVMMENATLGISRRYNLSSEQEEYTRVLLRERTLRFLEVYEDEMRGLLKELFVQQMSGQPPSPEQAKEWGQRAKPLLDESKRAILEGNMEWRDILTDEQVKTHDLDLKLMDANFRMLENRFVRWEQGQFRPGDWLGAGGRQPQAANQNPPRRPQTSEVPAVTEQNEDYWELYVKKFIRDYRLDETQRTAALAILKDCRDKAEQYRVTRKDEFDKAKAQLRAAMANKEVAEIRKAGQRIRDLERHINVLFEELKGRLESLPTDAQRQAHEARSDLRPLVQKKQPVASEPEAKPSKEPTSQPATQPVK